MYNGGVMMFQIAHPNRSQMISAQRLAASWKFFGNTFSWTMAISDSKAIPAISDSKAVPAIVITKAIPALGR